MDSGASKISILGGYSTSLMNCVGATSVTDTNWHHYAAVRNGNTVTIYLDGTSDATFDATGITFNNASTVFSIGRAGVFAGQYANGWIDEFRFSKGIARWTANFTPPTSPFGPSSGFFAFF